MKRSRRVFGYAYGIRIHDGRDVHVFTAKPKKEGAFKCVKPKWYRAFDDRWEYWEGK